MKCGYCDYINPKGAKSCACCGQPLAGNNEDKDVNIGESDIIGEDSPDAVEDIYGDEISFPEREDIDGAEKRTGACAGASTGASADANSDAGANADTSPEKSVRLRPYVIIGAILCLAAIVLVSVISLFAPRGNVGIAFSPAEAVYSPDGDRFYFICEGRLVDGYVPARGGYVYKSNVPSKDDRVTLFSHSYKREDGSGTIDTYAVTEHGVTRIETRDYTFAELSENGKDILLGAENGKYYTVKAKKGGEQEELPIVSAFSIPLWRYGCVIYTKISDSGYTVMRYDIADKESTVLCESAYHHLLDTPTEGVIVWQDAKNGMSTVYYAGDGRQEQIDGAYFSSNAVSPGGKLVSVNFLFDGEQKTYLLGGGDAVYVCDGVTPFSVSDEGDILYARVNSSGSLVAVEKNEDGYASKLLSSSSINYVITADCRNIMFSDDFYGVHAYGDAYGGEIVDIKTEEGTLEGLHPVCTFENSFTGMPFCRYTGGEVRFYYMSNELELVRIEGMKAPVSRGKNACFYASGDKLYVLREGGDGPVLFTDMGTAAASNIYVTENGRLAYWLDGTSLFSSDGRKVTKVASGVDSVIYSGAVAFYSVRGGSGNTDPVWGVSVGGSVGAQLLNGRAAHVVVLDTFVCVFGYTGKLDGDGHAVYDLYSGRSVRDLDLVIRGVRSAG